MRIHFQSALAACKVAPVEPDGDIDRPQGTGYMCNIETARAGETAPILHSGGR